MPISNELREAFSESIISNQQVLIEKLIRGLSLTADVLAQYDPGVARTVRECTHVSRVQNGTIQLLKAIRDA